MALVSCAPAIQQQILGTANSMRSGLEIEEEPVPEGDERIFVAVGKDVRESKSVLLWALQNNRGKKIYILHVHQPAQMIPILGGKFPVSKLKEQEIRAYRILEKEKMNKMLDEYLIICIRQRVRAEKLWIDMVDIEKGIVELVGQHGINKLVMGAAAEKHHSSCRRMNSPKSRKAIYVGQQANLTCNIWFVCKGTLICTREASTDGTGRWVTVPSPAASPSTSQFRSTSLPNGIRMVTRPVEEALRKSTSVHAGMLRSPTTPTSQQHLVAREETPMRSPSQGSEHSMWSASDGGDGTLGSLSTVRDEVSEDGLVLPSVHNSEEDLQYQSAENEREMERFEEQLYKELEQARGEAENSKQEAFEESGRRRKAENDALQATRNAKALENSYKKEMRLRKESEEALAREIQELDKIKRQHDEVIDELLKAQHQKQELETQIADSERTVKQLEENLAAAQQILSKLQVEKGELERDRVEAVREVEELRRRVDEEAASGSSRRPENISSFSPWEIEEATNNYAAELKIGEGGYGSVFRGIIRNTPVAIKTLHPQSFQGRSEFLQEVEVLSRVRHPNLVTLIGTCPESLALIYEFLPNGSLEDRLSCQNNSHPLSWQTRTRIATEICSALIFLHSNKPHVVVHGDLKPANILLDSHLVSKIGDFGICRMIIQSNTVSTLYVKTNPKGTFAYMDPEFLSTGELTTKSDIYSFGIIILRLLTRKPAIGIVKEVQQALDSENLQGVLDESAGKWPFVQAKQLAHMGLRCCEMNRKNRPDLVSEVWRVLEPMRASSSGATSFFQLAPNQKSRIPSSFICPIFQEIMRDPHIAADGFTYEAEALKGWLESGHKTSPITNHKLSHHELIPNHALRSAIQEWLQQP